MNATTPPSAWQMQSVISTAMRTLETLRTEQGQIIETDDELLAALAEEIVPVERIITLLVRAALDSKAMGVAADSRIADLRQRRERFQRAEAAYRKTVQDVLESLGLKKFVDPEFTLSLTDGRPKVIVTDADALPDELVKIETIRTPDKAAILKALLGTGELDAEFAEVIPGAHLSNGGSTLTVRTK